MRLCGSIKLDDSDTPQHLPLKWNDSTWDCGDLGLITHLWWKGGSTSVQSRLSYSHQRPNILTLYGFARVCLRAFFMSLSPRLRSSHLTSSTLSFPHLFTLLFIQTLAGECLICALALMKPLAEPHTVIRHVKSPWTSGWIAWCHLLFYRHTSMLIALTYISHKLFPCWEISTSLARIPRMWRLHRNIQGVHVKQSAISVSADKWSCLMLILSVSARS